MKSISEMLRTLFLLSLLGVSAMSLTACDEGPMEEAGEEIDDAVDEVGDELG